MRSLAALRQLPHHHAVEDVLAEGHAEHAVVQRDPLVRLLSRRDVVHGKLLHRERERIQQRLLYSSRPCSVATLLRREQREILHRQIGGDLQILQQRILLVFLVCVDIANSLAKSWKQRTTIVSAQPGTAAEQPAVFSTASAQGRSPYNPAARYCLARSETATQHSSGSACTEI